MNRLKATTAAGAGVLAIAAASGIAAGPALAASDSHTKPTVVLVSCAFEDAALPSP